MKKLLLLLFFVLHALTSWGQSRMLEGTVTDVSGEPIPGATIQIKGTQIATLADQDGKFRISLPTGSESKLVVSFVSMNTQEVDVTNQSKVNIKLADDVKELKDVVVVGYGSIKKSDLTGSIESVKADKLTLGGATNAAQMLQGRVAGLYINSQNQDPGATGDVFLRGVGSLSGSTSPLIVVDGFPSDNMAILNSINPNDIEQIDILKDASATAIFGARGANGVIIISTKSGKKGDVKIEYNSKLSIESLARKVDVMNSEDYIRYYYDLAHDPYFSFTFPAGHNGEFYPYPLDAIGSVQNTDWQKELTKSTQFSTDNNITLSGGSDNLTYRVSGGYLDGKGLVGPYEYKRFNTSSRINYSKNKFSLSADFGYNKENTDKRHNDYFHAIRFAPTVGKFNDQGKLSEFPVQSQNWFANPFYNEYNTEDFSEKSTTRLGYSMSYELFPGLKAEGRMGYERSFTETFGYQNPRYGNLDNGKSNTYNVQMVNLDAIMSYVKSFEKHNINVMAAANRWTNRSRGLDVSGQGFSSSVIKYYQMGNVMDKLNLDLKSVWIEKSISSLLGRLAYNYDNRYYVTVNYRRDGATQFGEANKWGNFPSVALAWRTSSEKFFDVNYINNFKLKFGYGLSGNANVPSGRSQSLIEYMPVYLGGNVVNGVIWQGGFFPNPELRWEGAKTLNGGIELGSEHFSIDINAYRKQSYDLLVDRPIPVEYGYEKITINKGELINLGLEAKIDGFLNFLGKTLNWRPSVWFAYNKNDVRNLDGSTINNLDIWDDKTFFGYAGRLTERYPMGAIFGYDYDGVWQENQAAEAAVYGAKPGDPRFIDRATSNAQGEFLSNGPDGQINNSDKRYLGSIYPAVTMGASSLLTYKQWSMSMMFDGVINKKVVNYNKLALLNPARIPYSNLGIDAKDRWTPNNTNTNIPSFTREVNKDLAISTFCVEDATFFRLSELTFAYNFNLKTNPYVKDLRLFVTGSNLFNLTNYTGLNPDVMGRDLTSNLMPITRKFIMGINLTF